MPLQRESAVASKEDIAITRHTRLSEEHARLDDVRSMVLALRPHGVAADLHGAVDKPDEGHRPDDRTHRVGPTTIGSDHQKALNLLDDVKNFIPSVMRENGQLRHDMLTIRSRAEAEISAAERKAREWKDMAESCKIQIATLETMVLDLRSKLHETESAVAVERELSSKSMQEAAEAECLSKLFEDTVISSFGIGTLFQDALTRIGRERD